jgi:hypothetical protein
MPNVSGSPTQVKTKVDTRAELSGTIVDGLDTGDQAFVRELDGSAIGPYYTLVRNGSRLPDGLMVLSVYQQPTDQWVSTSILLGGGGGALFPNRIDLSCNKARIDNPFSASPLMVTQTGPSLAGAYNGGGIGNKAILGFLGYDLLPLGALLDISWTWQNMAPQLPLIGNRRPYLNVVVDINGDDSVYKIFAIPFGVAPALVNNLVETPLGPNRFRYSWTPSNPVTTTQVVNQLLPVPPPVVAGGYPAPGAWPGTAYSVASIVAAWPNARLREVNSGDGGLPNGTVTAAIMLVTGDSGNQLLGAAMLEDITINGVMA